MEKTQYDSDTKGQLYAPWWLRLVTQLIDWTILFIGPALIACLLYSFSKALGVSIFLIVLGFYLYNRVYLLGSRGYTIGSKTNGIFFLTKDLETIGVGNAFVRELLKLISAGPWFLGFLWMLWDKYSQTWHDKLVGSRVYGKEALEQLLKMDKDQLAQLMDMDKKAATRFLEKGGDKLAPSTDISSPLKKRLDFGQLGRKLKKLDFKQLSENLLKAVRHEGIGFCCPECGSDLRKEQKFCSNCGSEIDWSEQ